MQNMQEHGTAGVNLFVVQFHRIHVNGHVDLQLVLNLVFDVVHQVVNSNKIRMTGHFHMTASDSFAHAIVVDD